MEILALLCLVAFGLVRIYWVNRTFFSMSELKATKGRVLDARIVDDEASFYYQYKVDGVLLGGSSYNTLGQNIKSHEMRNVFSDDITPDNPKDIEVYFLKDNPRLSIIKKPAWKFPIDGVFFVIIPSLYLAIQVLL